MIDPSEIATNNYSVIASFVYSWQGQVRKFMYSFPRVGSATPLPLPNIQIVDRYFKRDGNPFCNNNAHNVPHFYVIIELLFGYSCLFG